MGRSFIRKRIKKLKELADKEKDEDAKEILLIFHDVFKFLAERASGETEPEEPEDG